MGFFTTKSYANPIVKIIFTIGIAPHHARPAFEPIVGIIPIGSYKTDAKCVGASF